MLIVYALIATVLVMSTTSFVLIYNDVCLTDVLV